MNQGSKSVTITSAAFIVVLTLVGDLLLPSCMSREFIEGDVEIISVSDTTLNDSSIFVGNIYRLQDMSPNNSHPVAGAQIWLENLNLNTTSNASGYYYIKTVPGTYTIKCQDVGNNWPQLIEVIKQVQINKNEKVLINFYLGYTTE